MIKLDDLSTDDQLVLASEVLIRLVQGGINVMSLTTDDNVKIKVYLVIEGVEDDSQRSNKVS